jgi:phage pi2 protein 07
MSTEKPRKKIIITIGEYPINLCFALGILYTNSISSGNFILDNNTEIEENIDLGPTLVMPVKINTPNANIGVPINKKISDTNVNSFLSAHHELKKEDSLYLDSFTTREKILITNATGKWSEVYSRYSKTEEVKDDIFLAKSKKKDYLVSNISGKYKSLATNKIGHFIDFFNKMKKSEIWQDLEKLAPVPRFEKQPIIEQGGCYYSNDKEMKKLTNWTGFLRNAVREEEDGAIAWALIIEGTPILIKPHEVCSYRAFQNKIVQQGMYFYYGTDQQLKALFEYLWDKSGIDLTGI